MNKPLFNKVCIVGVGLIGGSLGMAIKKRQFAKLVVGVVRRDSTAKEAMRKKALDVAVFGLKEGVRGADLVILCGPVSVIVSQLKTISKHVSPKAVVIDVGSSKVEINNAGKKYLGTKFVGCHPMAGSEKHGIEFASADLFHGAVCFVSASNKRIDAFWKALGAKPVKMDARRHDAWVAKSSHLPHALSFSLFQGIDSKYPHNPSLKDLGRLAKSDARIWSDVFLSNRRPILEALSQFKKNLVVFEKNLRANRKPSLLRFIRVANRFALQK